MKKFTFSFKSLLLAAGLLLGSANAWGAAGDVTTNANIDFSSSITGTNPYTITGTVGSMTWTRQWTMTPNITDGIFRFGNMDDYGAAGYGGAVVELQNNTIGAKDVVTIKFDLAFGKLSGKHVGFKFVDKNGTDILTQWFDAYNGDFDDANPLDLNWSEMYRGSNEPIQERCVNFTITIDYAASTIKTETTCLLSGGDKPATNGSHTVSLPSSTPIGYFVLMGNINNTGRYSTFDNLLIKTTEGDYSTETANYTVKYQCGGVDIKDADVREGDVDAAIVLLASDKATFNKDDKRYIYESDDLGTKTIAEDGSTVVTITFREAAKYNYTITSSYDGAALPWSVAGSCWEDQNTITVSYPRYQASGSKLVGLAPVSNNLTKSITITGDDFESDLEYAYESIDNLYLLSEAENLGTGLATNATTYTDRVSNRLIIYGSGGTLTTLPAGKYIFTLAAIGGDNGSHKVNYTVSAGATQVASGTCTGNFLTLITSEEFVIPESTDITFTCSDPASGRGIDLVYVQKTGEVLTSSANLQGYKTFYNAGSNYQVDANTTIYKGSATKETVTLTSVDGNIIPKNTPVVLKTTNTTDFTIALTATETASTGDFTGNALLVADGGESGVYILAYTDAYGFGFYNFTGTLDEGDVYLAIPFSVKMLNVVVDGETVTGVEAPEVTEAEEEEILYNTAGVRVGKDYKGIVINQKGEKRFQK